MTKRFRRKIESNLDFLEKKLPDVKNDYNDPIHPVSGLYEIREKVTEIIKSAKSDIYLEIWSHDFKYIEQHLFDAYNRGLDIKIVGYDNFQCPFGTVFKHKNGRELELSLGGRMIFLLADNTEGLFGKAETKAIKASNKYANIAEKLAKKPTEKLTGKAAKALNKSTKLAEKAIGEKTALKTAQQAGKAAGKFGKIGKYLKSSGAGIMVVFSGLAELFTEVVPTFKELGKEKTVLISTHILSEVEANCSRAIIINQGNVIADADPKHLTLNNKENNNSFAWTHAINGIIRIVIITAFARI